MILNINKDDLNLNDFIHCWSQFKSRPNRISIDKEYITDSISNYFKELKIENSFTEIKSDYDKSIINNKFFIKLSDDIYLSYVSLDKNSDISTSVDFSFLYKNEYNLKEIEKIIEDIDEFSIKNEVSNSIGIDLVTIDSGDIVFENASFDNFDNKLKIDMSNFEILYSSYTINNLNKVIKNIKKNKRGLSVFYGEKGTGKTSIIKYLSKKLYNRFIYIPNSMIEHTINNPEFNKILKNIDSPLIIIDDCEFILNNSYPRYNIFSNNLIQMVDGLVSNNLNIITIFNTNNIDDIDLNIINMNSLIGCVEFKYLSITESNDLSKYLGYKLKYKNKSRLIDIIKKNIPINKKIGF
jgi:hypothetical protein